MGSASARGLAKVTAYEHAQRYVGIILERPGGLDHPLIQWWLSLCSLGMAAHDETPWCSAFCNGIAWDLRLPRSKSAAARSWLLVGQPVTIEDGKALDDVVILTRGAGEQPGPLVTSGAPGHVGFFGGYDYHLDVVHVLGGNQSNGITVMPFKRSRVLGVRRLRI